MSPVATQISFLRALKGAPASILMALMLTGRAHTQRELQLTTGYSDKPISEALDLLALAGVVRHEEAGWMLAVPPEALIQFTDSDRPPAGAEAGEAEAEELSTGRKISDPPGSITTTTTTPIPLEREVVAVSKHKTSPKRKNSDPAVDNSGEPVDNSGESPPATGGKPPGRAAPDPDSRPAPDQSEVRAWLERAGIGGGSLKMRQLLAAGLSARYVQAHVLEREYRLRWRQVKPGEYSVGLLIRRLEDGDPAPPMRCVVCLDEMPCRYSH